MKTKNNFSSSFFLFLFLFLFLSSNCFVFVLSSTGNYKVEDGVAVLTLANFDSVVNAEEMILVEFYAPWCGHCKSLAPEYAKAAKQLHGKIVLAKVDAIEETELGDRFDIQGFPTLKLFRKGVASEYKGGRTADTIISYLQKQMMPAVTTLSSVEKIQEFSTSSKVIVIGAFATASGDAYTEYNKVVNKLRDDFTFGEVVDPSLAANGLSISSSDLPSIVLFKQFDEGKVIYSGDFDSKSISFWVQTQALMLLDEISRENYKYYMDSGLPLAFLFFDPADAKTREDLTSEFTPIAKQFRGVVNFVFCDGIKYANQAKNLGLSGDIIPSLAVLGNDQSSHYAFDEKTSLKSEAVIAWVSKLADGSLPPTIKSEPVPKQTEPVYILVGSTFESIAHDESKDVLVEFYAPWCGHCKSLAPIYDQVGAHFKDVSSVVIAKMDATANDAVGVAIQGFPTIIFFPAGEKTQVVYEGGRDFESIVSFVKKNAKIPFTLGGEEKSKTTSHDHDHDHDHHGHDHSGHHHDHDEL